VNEDIIEALFFFFLPDIRRWYTNDNKWAVEELNKKAPDNSVKGFQISM